MRLLLFLFTWEIGPLIPTSDFCLEGSISLWESPLLLECPVFFMEIFDVILRCINGQRSHSEVQVVLTLCGAETDPELPPSFSTLAETSGNIYSFIQ